MFLHNYVFSLISVNWKLERTVFSWLVKINSMKYNFVFTFYLNIVQAIIVQTVEYNFKIHKIISSSKYLWVIKSKIFNLYTKTKYISIKYNLL